MKIQQFIWNQLQFICYYWDTDIGMLQILWKHDSFELIVILHYTVLYNKGIFNKAAF